VKLLPVLVILTAITVIGTLNTMAFADPGNTEITDIFPQGGIAFDVLDPDGIKSVEWVNPGSELQVVNADCEEPQTTSTNFIFGTFTDNPGPNTFVITDCQPEMSQTTCEIITECAQSGDPGCSATCTFDPSFIGGEFLPTDSTALMLAGLQSSAIWMLPVLAGVAGSAFGILYIKSRRN